MSRKTTTSNADRSYDIAIIGGGIVGLATAYQIAKLNRGLRILVLEKESRLGAHQSSHNSGVIHSGLYYRPDSLKAKNCVEGRRELIEFLKKQKLPYEICGKLVIATDKDELSLLDRLLEKGTSNGLKGLKRLSSTEIKEKEPCATGLAAIFVPEAGITDYPQVMNELETILRQSSQIEIKLNHPVVEIEPMGKKVFIRANGTVFGCRLAIGCSGLHADRVCQLEHVQPKARIIPFRGDYYRLKDESRKKVKNLIYPVPDPTFPFLGVHFTRHIDGSVTCGPNAVFSFQREGYAKLDWNLGDSLNALLYPGTWNLFRKNWKYGIDEYWRALSKKKFLQAAQKLIPSLQMDEIEPAPSGVRAAALSPEGNLIDDFQIETTPQSIHVINAPSPAATACFAIGKTICEMAMERLQ